MKSLPLEKNEPESHDISSGPSTMDYLLGRDCSREEFFLLYSKLLQERMPNHVVEFSSDSVMEIRDSEGKKSSTHLENLWLKYHNGNEDRSGLIEKYLRLALELGRPEVPPLRENIIGIIKDSQYLEFMRPVEEFAVEHLCADLWIVYAEDRPETTATLKIKDVSEMGIHNQELRELAIENLQRLLPQVECNGDGPWYSLTAGGTYEASILLLDTVWDQLQEKVAGEVVATTPTRDVLLFTGSEAPDGVHAIREKSKEICSSGPHAISETLIVRRGTNWFPFNAN